MESNSTALKTQRTERIERKENAPKTQITIIKKIPTKAGKAQKISRIDKILKPALLDSSFSLDNDNLLSSKSDDPICSKISKNINYSSYLDGLKYSSRNSSSEEEISEVGCRSNYYNSIDIDNIFDDIESEKRISSTKNILPPHLVPTPSSSLQTGKFKIEEVGEYGLKFLVENEGKQSRKDKRNQRQNLGENEPRKPFSRRYSLQRKTLGRSRNKGFDAKLYNSYRVTPHKAEKRIIENLHHSNKDEFEQQSDIAVSFLNQERAKAKVFQKNDKEPERRDKNQKEGEIQIERVRYKTELCFNWLNTGFCPYMNRCNFGHGVNDLRVYRRVRNYKTQMCCDPARVGFHSCAFGKKCNYLHPGEPMRRIFSRNYFDQEYYNEVGEHYGDMKFPFGVYI